MSSLQENGLKKQKLGLLAIVGMIYSLTASGAWGLEDMIPGAGPGLVMIMLFVLPFIWGLPQAFIDAELASSFPQEGGPYVWVKETLGEFWGFQTCWWKSVGGYFDVVTYVVLAAAYLQTLFHLDDRMTFIFKVAIILIMVIINLCGVKDVSFVNTAISISILVAFAVVSVIGFAHFHYNPVMPMIPENQSLITSIGAALAVGMWMYNGWESMSFVAGEVEKPQLIPKGLMVSIPLIIGTYVIPTVAGLGSVGRWSEWGTDGVSYIDVLQQYCPSLVFVFLIITVLSNISMFNGYITTPSRGFFVLAEDNLCPKFFTKCSKKRGVPYVGIVSVGIFSLLLCQLSFVSLVVATVTMNLFAGALIQLAGIMRRKKKVHPDGPFKFHVGDKFFYFYASFPIVLAAVALYLDGTVDFVNGLVGVVSGPIAYIVFRKIYGGLSKKDPKKYPVNPVTKLVAGDMKRCGFVMLVWAVLAVFALFFFPWFEAPEAIYIHAIAIMAVICTLIGIVTYVYGVRKDNAKLF